MSDLSVYDLRHLLPDDPATEPPVRVQRLEAFVGRIAQAASAREAGALSETAIRCRRRPGRKPCAGRVDVLRRDVPPEVQWRCPTCGDEGIVTGWRGTHWDLAGTPSLPPSDPEDGRLVEAVFDQEQYEMMRDEVSMLEATSELILARARPAGPGRVSMTGRPDDWEFLMGEVAAEANRADKPRIQRGLDELVVRLDIAVG